MVTMRRIGWAAAVSLCLALSLIVFFEGLSPEFPMRQLEAIALFLVGAVVVAGPFVMIAMRMADYRSPESDAEFEELVQRSERLAREDLAAEPDEGEFMALDPYDDGEFAELVRDALDDLPGWAREALDNNVGVVISDGGAKRGAYGLYHGDGVARDNYPDTITIYRDTLRRDFGGNADRLREEVTRVVRHELAHHLGWDELGVRGLGL